MSNDLRNPLQRARGLGSAKEGVAHWWTQRSPRSPWSAWASGS